MASHDEDLFLTRIEFDAHDPVWWISWVAPLTDLSGSGILLSCSPTTLEYVASSHASREERVTDCNNYFTFSPKYIRLYFFPQLARTQSPDPAWAQGEVGDAIFLYTQKEVK